MDAAACSVNAGAADVQASLLKSAGLAPKGECTWQRVQSADASTTLPEDCGEIDWLRCQSGFSAISDAEPAACPDVVTDKTKDWRQLTVSLRQALGASRAAAAGEADLMDLETLCPDRVTAETKDWRPLTVALRAQLEAELAARSSATASGVEPKQLCPDELTADTKDWRPLTSSLRTQLHAELEVQAAGDAGTIDPEHVCPKEITSESEDWRPLTASLRKALAASKEAEAVKESNTAKLLAEAAACRAREAGPSATCPELVTPETLDWRPLTNALRGALAASRDAEAAHEAEVAQRAAEAAARRAREADPDTMCPEQITPETEDWRPLTVSLRAALARARRAEAAKEAESACPKEVTAETPDWRPLTVSLRAALAATKEASAAPDPDVRCPEEVTSETPDWRPLTVSLRKQLAAARQAEAAGGQAKVAAAKKAHGTSPGGSFIALALLTAVIVAWAVRPALLDTAFLILLTASVLLPSAVVSGGSSLFTVAGGLALPACLLTRALLRWA